MLYSDMQKVYSPFSSVVVVYSSSFTSNVISCCVNEMVLFLSVPVILAVSPYLISVAETFKEICDGSSSVFIVLF